MAINIYEGDSRAIRVTVTDEAEAPVDITGATVTAAVEREDGNGSAIAATTVSITDGPGGVVTAFFAPGVILGPTAAGETETVRYLFQCRVVLAPESQVVVEEKILVRRAVV